MKLVCGFAAVLCHLLIGGLAADFPSDIKKCPYGDSNCLKDTITYILQNKYNGDKAIHLVQLDPLLVTSINIKQGKDSPVNVDLKLRDSQLYGVKYGEVLMTKGFEKNLKGPHEIQLKSNAISLQGKYDISGKVLILPITGNGDFNLTISEPVLTLHMRGRSVEKSGKAHMKLEKLTVNLDVKKIYVYFSNLFNGDKILGDTMNTFLNENWEEIYEELKGAIINALEMIFEGTINNVFDKVPYEDLFSKDQS